MVAEAIGVIEYREVASKLGEMATNCEMLRLAMDGFEHSTARRRPGIGPHRCVDGADHVAHDGAAARDLRLRHRHAAQRERPREPGAAARTSSASCAARTSTSSTSRACSALAHDLAMSSFGMRQDIYEYWHGGDPSRNRINLLRAYDQDDIKEPHQGRISRPLPHGEVE